MHNDDYTKSSINNVVYIFKIYRKFSNKLNSRQNQPFKLTLNVGDETVGNININKKFLPFFLTNYIHSHGERQSRGADSEGFRPSYCYLDKHLKGGKLRTFLVFLIVWRPPLTAPPITPLMYSRKSIIKAVQVNTTTGT